MLPIVKREISSFFSSPMAYLVIGIFLLLNGLFLWVFKGPYNIIDNGFADLSPFFQLAPLILLFLVPAITMKSLSEEIKMGTMELLLTKPIGTFRVVMEKFTGSLLLVIIAIIPTFLYVYSVSSLGNPPGNLDMGAVVGSYLGLLLLAAAYTAIGIFTSALTDNQIIAFIAAVLLCFAFYFGFDGLADLSTLLTPVEFLSLKFHYDSLSRGVLYLSDLVYFAGITGLFLYLTQLKLAR
ncbi:gliding motility-associated ABC transporter permease subunit GldF [Robertkochia aurantiaca]|uniref:gliding motility-associated ABC transporter permease subunit GldF n=1 Tax=Robertkochia aurantiaca TaxID=2873700 RepID=UPI001CCE346C|nr:gliding motility-associated ABC transporter permease subunit GldF [Robertkochia sp. 3YJGBD-33]